MMNRAGGAILRPFSLVWSRRSARVQPLPLADVLSQLEETAMKIPPRALVVLANGERFVLMRNVGEAFAPKLQRLGELDLELTNFAAGARHQDPAGQRAGSTDIDELAHGAAIAEWLNERALKGRLGQVVVAADPKTLGQIRRHSHKELQSRIVGELAKDLVNSPIPAVEKALASA
jgi:protein required for attachment to host cells